MSILRKKTQYSGPYPVTTANTTVTTAPSNFVYTPSSSGSCYINTGGFATISSSGVYGWGTQDYKSYIDPHSYVKAKLKDGNEVEVTLKDYINYPVRMGKELEDSTIEEFNEWKMVNEL